MTGAVSLRLPARPENVAVVRQALTGLGDAYDLDADLLGDIKTAVTEACNNVVLHAYADTDEGFVEVEADSDGTGARVLVRDFGGGIQPRPIAVEERTLGLGLPLIATLSRSFQIRGGPGLGLEVEMVFAPAEYDRFDALSDQFAPRVEHPFASESRAAGMLIQPGPLVAPVTSRVTAILAARADFPLDRLADAVLVSDAIAAHASEYISGSDVGVEISDGDGSLEFRIGPLDEGGAQGLLQEMDVPGLGHSLERLVDEVSVERGSSAVATEGEEAEYLALRIGKD